MKVHEPSKKGIKYDDNLSAHLNMPALCIHKIFIIMFTLYNTNKFRSSYHISLNIPWNEKSSFPVCGGKPKSIMQGLFLFRSDVVNSAYKITII